MTAKTVPKDIKGQLFWWRAIFWFWNILHYALGLSTAAGAGLIASQATAKDYVLIDGKLPITLAIAVALATAALTFFRASAKANAYIQAWRMLNNECMIFTKDENYTEKMLADQHKKAEEIIGKVD